MFVVEVFHEWSVVDFTVIYRGKGVNYLEQKTQCKQGGQGSTLLWGADVGCGLKINHIEEHTNISIIQVKFLGHGLENKNIINFNLSVTENETFNYSAKN